VSGRADPVVLLAQKLEDVGLKIGAPELGAMIHGAGLRLVGLREVGLDPVAEHLATKEWERSVREANDNSPAPRTPEPIDEKPE
jgi:hypothetical protein